MEETRRRIDAILPHVKNFMRIGGTPGTSIGVLHQGHIIGTYCFGHQDIDSKNPIASTSRTLYPLGSLSKMFVASICAQLVRDNVLQWDGVLSDYLPDFESVHDPRLSKELRLIDLLAHLTGLARKDAMWLGSDNEVLLDKTHLINVCNDLKPLQEPREKWIYSNFMYALVGQIIERRTEKSFGTVLEKMILEPLEMHSTTVKSTQMQREHLAVPYLVGEDKTLYPLGNVGMLDNSPMAPAGGIRSNVDDMLKLASALVHMGLDKPPKLANLDKVLSAHAILERKSDFDELYALGLAKVTTPTTFGKMGFNPGLLDEMPVLGEESHSELVFYHNGSMPGFNHCFMMVPRTRTAIVVLTNCTPHGDAADWIAQTILQAVMQFKPSAKMEGLAKEAAQKWIGMYDAMKKTLDSERKPHSEEPAHQILLGKYMHSTRALYLDVYKERGELKFKVNGMDSQVHLLRHYHYTTFTFFPSAYERNRRGMIQYNAHAWLLDFHKGEKGVITHVKWTLDQDVPDGEIFNKI